MREFVIVSAQPDDLLFCWTLRVQLHQFRQIGWSKYYQILLFTPSDRIDKPRDQHWVDLINDYPEAKFFFYPDKQNFLNTIHAFSYIPLLRPHILEQHWKKYPELKEATVLYTDSDVLYLSLLPLNETILDNDTCYLSNTAAYNSASYFDSKAKDVLPEKLESYKKRDVLQECLSFFSLTRNTAVENENKTGGAQYILKNIDAQFWVDVSWGIIQILVHLRTVNDKYFESENKGFQSWCADMWSVLWTLWKRSQQTETPSFMDFAWATDPISKWNEVFIYHDAGATNETDLFNKRNSNYVNNIKTPYDDDLSYVNKDFCSSGYVKAIIASDPKNSH